MAKDKGIDNPPKDKGIDHQLNEELQNRDEEISEFRSSIDILLAEAKGIKDESVEVANLMQKIGNLNKDIRELEKVKGNQLKFTTKLKLLTERRSALTRDVLNTKGGVAEWQIQKDEVEYKKGKSHFVKAKERMEELVAFIKNYNLEKSMAELVGQLEKKMSGIKTLLDGKEYEDAINQSEKFIYEVGNALMTANDIKMEQEELSAATEPAKTAEPAPTASTTEPASATPSEPVVGATQAEPAKPSEPIQRLSQKQRKEKGIVVKKLVPNLGMENTNAPDAAAVEQAKKEQDKMDEDCKKAEANLILLKSIITEGGKHNSALRNFTADLRTADSSLRVAFKTELPEICARNLKNVQEAIDKILSTFSPRLKHEYEIQKDGAVKPPEPAIEKKPVAQKTAEEIKKEAEDQQERMFQRKDCEDDLILLVRIIRDADKKENNHKLFDSASKELRMMEDYLPKMKAANNPANRDVAEFNKNLDAFNKAAKKLAARLGAGIAEAFERGGLPEPKRSTEPVEKEPAPAVMSKEQKEARDGRKRLCDERWTEVARLEKIIRDIDSKEKKNNKLVEHYQVSLGAVKDLLKKGYASLDNQEDFDQSIAAFTDTFRDVKDGLPPEIKTALERGGAKKAAQISKNEPAEPLSSNIGKGSEKQDKRTAVLLELSGQLSDLEAVINEKIKNKPADYFAKDIIRLKEYLEKARKTKISGEFYENIRNFEGLFNKMREEVRTAGKESAKLTKGVDVVPVISTEPQPASLSAEPVVSTEPVPKIKRVRVKKVPATTAIPAEVSEAKVVSSSTVEASKSSERKRRILDIPEKDLLEIVGERKLQEVVNEIILGNADVAKVLMKDIFSRKDIDLEHLNGVLEKFGYTPVQFMKEWAETLHIRAFEVAKQWVEQMSRNWLNKNIKLWDKIKENPMAHAKLLAVNILPFAALGASIGAFATVGGAAHIARGAIVGGATGLLRGLKAKVGSVRGWFGRRNENAQKEIAEGRKNIEEEKAVPLRDGLLAQFTGENGPDMMEQLSAMLSQSLRDASATGIQQEAVEKMKSGAAIAVEEISAKIDVEFEAMKKSAGAETAKEVQRSQTERAETLISKLYEDKDLEALIQKVIERDPKIVNMLKKLKINGIEFGEFIKEEDKDPIKKESNARKAASILASGVAGMCIGGAIAAAPELRAVLGAVAGGYLGVKYGHLKDRHAREAQFEKEFKDSIANAENVIIEWEKRKAKEPFLELTPEILKVLAERAKDLRAPLNLQMLEGDINLKLRAQNALRRIESMQINLYINENPGVEGRAIPEAQRNSGVERLLTGLNSELEELTKHQQNIEQRILRKPGWWRAIGYGVVGAVVGAGAGYGTAKAQEYLHGHNKQVSHPTAEEGAQHPHAEQGVDTRENRATFKPHELPREQTHSLDHVIQKEFVTLDHNELHEIDVVTLDDSQGVLSGVYLLRQAHPELFIHDDGTAWTNAEIHKWNVDELKAMGGKYIKGELVDGKPTAGKWVMPFETHGPKHGEPLIDPDTGKPTGARVGLYTDENGRPHFKLAGEEHVTIKKYYDVGRLQGADKHVYNVVDTGAVAGREGDYQINPLPDNYGVTYTPTVNADGVSELALTHTPIKVDANIREMAIVHHAPTVSDNISKDQPVAPVSKGADAGQSVVDKSAAPGTNADAPVNHLLAERGIKPEEFVGTLHKMGENMTTRLHDSLAPSDEANEFLKEKLSSLAALEEKYRNALEHGQKLSDADLQQIDKLLKVEALYKNGKSNWVESLDKTIFNEDDNKVMQLAFAPHKNPGMHPILANNSHAVRIWNPAEKKDILWYKQDTYFSLDKNKNLVMVDRTGVSVISKEDALALAR